MSQIEAITSASIAQVRKSEVEPASGRVLAFAYAMIVPPFAGVDVVAQTPGLANPMGFIPVDERYRHPDFEDIYAAGVAIAIALPAPTPVRAGVRSAGAVGGRRSTRRRRRPAASVDRPCKRR